MVFKCSGNCIECGKCAGKSFAILDSFNKNSLKFTPRKGYGIALDVGTTSVVLALINLNDGKIMARHSFMNPQRAYGADVITRINEANNGKSEDLRIVILESIDSGIKTLIESKKIRAEEVKELVIAANTVMIYLLMGFSCKNLGVFPFITEYVLKEKYSYRELYKKSVLNCPVHIVPWFSAFVGGDVTAGLINVISEINERFLFIDLGTNGEMALFDHGNIFYTSTAAGPAFESGNRSGGASAVIENLAACVCDGAIDETGRLKSEAKKEDGISTPPLNELPSLMQGVEAGVFALGVADKNSFFTQEEIRNLQLAKSAVRSGFEILLESAGLFYNDIDFVYLAGGIGQAINIESAVMIKLLPQEVKDKVFAVGNACLGGAAKILLAPQEYNNTKNLIKTKKEINLSEHPKFSEYFTEYMYF